MDLKTYIADPGRKKALSLTSGAHPQWLWQVATGWRGKRASPILAVRIESATGGIVSRYELRPDVFGDAPKTKAA